MLIKTKDVQHFKIEKIDFDIDFDKKVVSKIKTK